MLLTVLLILLAEDTKKGKLMEWNENLIKITDFSTVRKIDRNAVTQYIRRHPELFEGHTVVYRKALYGDDDAIRVLDKKYPLSTSTAVEIVQDPEVHTLQKQVIELQEVIIASQKKIQALTEYAAMADARQLLIEEKTKQIEEQKKRMDELEKECDDAKKRSSLYEAECYHLSEKVADESRRRIEAEEKMNEIKNMGLIQRLFWKG